MTGLYIAFSILTLAAVRCQIVPLGELDLVSMSGVFYQVFTSPNAQLMSSCVTYQYAAENPTTLNVERKGTSNGEELIQNGVISIDQGAISWSGGLPTSFEILKVGDVSSNGQYEYIVQSEDNNMVSLLVGNKSAAMSALSRSGISASDLVAVNHNCTNSPAPEPVEELILNQFVGHWFLVLINENYRAIIADDDQSENGLCLSATYTRINYDSISVYISQSVGSLQGRVDDITGTAVQTEIPGVLSVTYGGIDETFEYVVIALGPVVDGSYDYAAVTDASGKTLFVLARDVRDFEEMYLIEALMFLSDVGYTDEASIPRPVYHDSSCSYPTSEQAEVEPVNELILALYAGQWVQLYHNDNARMIYSLGNNSAEGVCISVTYGVINASAVSVLNVQRVGTPQGPIDDVTGVAVTTNTTGVLSVSFQGISGAFSYVVIALGPIRHYLYDYAVITDEDGFTLFVLTRDIEYFDQNYADEVLDFLDGSGFTEESNKPKRVFHDDSCTYPLADPAMNPLLSPVDELNLSQYVGRWYQVIINDDARGSFVEGGLSDEGVCIAITYCILNQTSISVWNVQQIGTPQGAINDITGKAVATEDPGIFTVYFDGISGSFPYWVLQLGPVVDNAYQYAIVSEPDSYSLFVLARDVQAFRENYMFDVVTYIDAVGFGRELGTPRLVYHESSCLYPTSPTTPFASSSGCLPEGLDAGYWVLIAIGIILVVAAIVATSIYYIRASRRSYDNIS